MKRFILILSLTLCVLGVWGQLPKERPKRTPEQEAQRRVEMMSHQLQLTSQQAEKIYQIQLKYARLRRAATKREDFVDLMHEMNEELQMILTQEQFEMYKSWLNGRKHKHPSAFGKQITHPNESSDSIVKEVLQETTGD